MTVNFADETLVSSTFTTWTRFGLAALEKEAVSG